MIPKSASGSWPEDDGADRRRRLSARKGDLDHEIRQLLAGENGLATGTRIEGREADAGGADHVEELLVEALMGECLAFDEGEFDSLRWSDCRRSPSPPARASSPRIDVPRVPKQGLLVRQIRVARVVAESKTGAIAAPLGATARLDPLPTASRDPEAGSRRRFRSRSSPWMKRPRVLLQAGLGA